MMNTFVNMTRFITMGHVIGNWIGKGKMAHGGSTIANKLDNLH
jgi:hypothetical protein